MTDLTLRADCARCAALCCVALAFDRSPEFAIDKPNGVACPHLAADHRCAIHADRAAHGFGGCVGYDCLGAGQRVTQELFGGRSWRDEPALLAPMTRAFTAMQRVHALLSLLRATHMAALTPDEAGERDRLETALCLRGGWREDDLAVADDAALHKRVRAFLAGLRRHYAR